MSDAPRQRTISELLLAAGGIAFISKAMGLGYTTALSWSDRNSIPSEYWSRLQILAAHCGNTITSDDLIAVHTPAGVEAVLRLHLTSISQNARAAS